MTTALTQTTIKVCNVDVDGDFSIEIEDGGDEASMTLTVQRSDDGAPVARVHYMLPAAARALAAALLRTADAIDG
jgi:hypothetical protein